MDIRKDIIYTILTGCGQNKYEYLRDVETVLPRWTIDDMSEAITMGNKSKADQILSTWDYLVDAYVDYQDKTLASCSPRDIPSYTEKVIKKINMIRDCMKRIHDYLDGNSLHVEAVSYGLFNRLDKYDPKNPPSVPQVARSLDDIVCPGQRILVSDVDSEMLTGDVTSDVVFYYFNENDNWRYDWKSSSNYQPTRLPLQSSNEYEDYGYFYEQHKADDDETRMRHEEYINAGFGKYRRKRVIFVQDGKFFVCLGSSVLDKRRFGRIKFNERPCCFWLYPSF